MKTRLDIKSIRRAVKRMAAMSKGPGQFTQVMSPGTLATLYGVKHVTSYTPVSNVFTAVQTQVRKYKRNVISKEVLESKRDIYLAEVTKEVEAYTQTPEYKAYVTKIVQIKVRRVITDLLSSQEFTNKLYKLGREALENGIK